MTLLALGNVVEQQLTRAGHQHLPLLGKRVRVK
jgi:hypothetical protein